MNTLTFALIAGVTGFVTSIFIWPRLRQVLLGVENEIDDLRAKATTLEAELETKLRG